MSRQILTFAILFGMLFNGIAVSAATMCEHPDGNRYLEWTVASVGCHTTDADECASSSSPAFESCSDYPLEPQQLGIRGNDRPLRLDFGVLAPTFHWQQHVHDMAAARSSPNSENGLPFPPGDPLLLISTIILLA